APAVERAAAVRGPDVVEREHLRAVDPDLDDAVEPAGLPQARRELEPAADGHARRRVRVAAEAALAVVRAAERPRPPHELRAQGPLVVRQVDEPDRVVAREVLRPALELQD